MSSKLEDLKKTGEAPTWLTEAGYKTLCGGYLINADETPKGMYTRVSKAAAKHYSNPKEWENKFFTAMWNNWLCIASPIASNMGTDRGLPISCLAGDTWLNTREHGIQIKDVQVGDELLTHEGRYQKVTAKKSRMSSGDLYKIKVDNRFTDIEITGNHPVLTNKGWIRVDKLDAKKHLIAINNKIENLEKSSRKNSISIDDATVFFFGRSLDKENIPHWIIDLPKEQLSSFFDGVLVSSKYKNSNDNFNLNVSTAEQLLGLYNVCLKLDIPVTLELSDKVFKLSKSNRFNSNEKVLYSQIINLEKVNYDKEVFDISVENDNSFSAAGVIVHNCNSIHIGDSVDSIFTKVHELAMLSKNGAGVGIYMGDIRGRGAPISGNGSSEGIIPWAKTLDTATVAVSQGCYDKYTELLTKDGWVKFKDLKFGTKVAQSTDKGIVSFVDYTDYIEYTVDEDLFKFTNKVGSIDLLVTGNHRMAVQNKNESLEIVEAEKLSVNVVSFWSAARGNVLSSNKELSSIDKFRLAYDACSVESKDNSTHKLKVSHNFKADILIDVLKDLRWEYSNFTKNDEVFFSVTVPSSVFVSKRFADAYDVSKFSSLYSKSFINELNFWSDSTSYSNSIESNVDFVQSVAFLAGRSAVKDMSRRTNYPNELKYKVFIFDSSNADQVVKTTEHYKGKVYCVTVPTGILVVRRNGTIALCGNSTRRGASAAYLPIEHIDIEEFLNMRRPVGDQNRRCLNINHGVCISDEWMNSMLAGDKNKRKTWESVLLNRVETGEPYIFFSDNVNKNNPDCYKGNNLKVSTSNICCLSGSTYVSTRGGAKRMDSLVGKTVEIFDGDSWVENAGFELKGKDELIRVHFSDGSYVDSNPKHRWFLSNNSNHVFTVDLKLGDELLSHSHTSADKDDGMLSFGKNSVVVKMEKLSGTHPVYCTNVPSTGKFALANGLMTGNSEITLYTDPDHTFVCCLSSLNVVRWDEWKDTDTVNVAVRFLDAVLQEYIDKTEHMKGMEASRRSAIKGRAIGIGVLGWHTLLQRRSLPFDHFETMRLNAEIFKSINKKANAESAIMAQEFGEPEWCKGYGKRHTHLMACAPTVSNSTISGGFSAGIEPIAANIFSQKSAKGVFIIKNLTLEVLLESKGFNTIEVWDSINDKSGSVQHLTCLTDHEKQVFLTAREINQHAVVKLAVQRQKWIDQAQSVNLFFASNASPKYIHDVHIAAWRDGLKTLYYLRSEGVLKSDLASRSESDCKACEA